MASAAEFAFLTYPSIQWLFNMHSYKNKLLKPGGRKKNKDI